VTVFCLILRILSIQEVVILKVGKSEYINCIIEWYITYYSKILHFVLTMW